MQSMSIVSEAAIWIWGYFTIADDGDIAVPGYDMNFPELSDDAGNSVPHGGDYLGGCRHGGVLGMHVSQLIYCLPPFWLKLLFFVL